MGPESVLPIEITFPAFWGRAGESQLDCGSPSQVRQGRTIWPRAPRWVRLWTNTLKGHLTCSEFSENEDEKAAFTWGQPLFAGDAQFGKHTAILPATRCGAARRSLELYKQHGEEMFARIENAFALVLLNPKKREILLVADKFGCEDVYFHKSASGFLFASHPQLLLTSESRFDPVSAAFFLAQEAFVPAPFTLSGEIESVGRGKYLRIRVSPHRVEIERVAYWRPEQKWAFSSGRHAERELLPVLDSAIQARRSPRSGILLSGGLDSSLILQIVARRERTNLLSITGRIAGHLETEQDSIGAAELASALGIEHESVTLDAHDEDIPAEWEHCSASSPNGTRAAIPLFLRMARRFRERLGPGCSVFSGQFADTLADNNYTLSSAGYTLRRLLFSSAVQRIRPMISRILPGNQSVAAQLLMKAAQAATGPRLAGMLESLLDGAHNAERFYAGRIFGFGEMPGLSRRYFPMLTEKGFECVADWYISSFVRAIVSRLDGPDFRCAMTEMSLDMVMLHLDTRLVFHAMRLGGAEAALPFLDARVVNYFVSLPESAHAIWRPPKHVIREQLRLCGGILKKKARRRVNRTNRPQLLEEVLLSGSLGAHFRELLCCPTALSAIPQFFELVDGRWLEQQLRQLQRGDRETNWKFICRLAALEVQTQRMFRSRAASSEPAWAGANA